MDESFRWSFGELRESDWARASDDARSVPARPPQAEQLFGGRYRVESELGRGGMGVVLRALDLETQGPVALKILTHALDERQRARFAREGALAAGLAHPGLVRVLGGGVQGEQPFLVLELVEDARCLDDALEGLALPRKLALLLQVARAVGAAHRAGVVHRDLKFGNILVDPTGQPKVCDFGLAWRVDLDPLTQTGTMLGTPTFMSPEQAGVGPRESDPVGPRTDVWALGVLLYHALSGVLPFRSSTLIALVHEIHDRDPFPIQAEVGAEVRPELEAVCRRALAKRSADRFADADAFAEALSAAARARPAGRRGVRAAIVAALLVAAVAGVGALASRQTAVPAPPADASPGPASAATADGRALLREARRLATAGAPAPQVFTQLESALRAAAGEPELTAEVQLELTRAAFERGHYTRGLEPAAALRDHPLHGREARFLRAILLGWLERHGEALSEYRSLTEEDDRWGILAQASLAVRRGRELRSIAGRLAARLPRDVFAASLRNQVHLRAKDYERVLRVLEGVEVERPTVHLLVNLATVRLGLGPDLEQPRRLIEQATALASPSEPPALNAAWSNLLLREGDPAGALVYLRRRAERLTNPKALLALGAELEQAGALSEARAVWRKSLALGGAGVEKQVRRLALPLRLRILRALELPFIRQPLPPEARRWVAQQVASLPEGARAAATRALSRCVAGRAWRDLKDGVEELRRLAPRSAEAALLEGRLQISRDRVAPALKALARARGLGAPEDAVALEEAMATARASGFNGVRPQLTALAARDVPEGWVAAAVLAWSKGDPRRALTLCDRALRQPRAPFSARALHVLTLLTGGKGSEAVWASDPYLKESRCADRWLTGIRTTALQAVLQRQVATPAQRRALFWGLELAMSLSSHPLPRLDAAEEALLAGPTSVWFASSKVWLREAQESEFELQEPLRTMIARRTRAVQGLSALVQGGSAAEVERHWRGLMPAHVHQRGVTEFQRRFGRAPALARPK